MPLHPLDQQPPRRRTPQPGTSDDNTPDRDADRPLPGHTEKNSLTAASLRDALGAPGPTDDDEEADHERSGWKGEWFGPMDYAMDEERPVRDRTDVRAGLTVDVKPL